MTTGADAAVNGVAPGAQAKKPPKRHGDRRVMTYDALHASYVHSSAVSPTLAAYAIKRARRRVDPAGYYYVDDSDHKRFHVIIDAGAEMLKKKLSASGSPFDAMLLAAELDNARSAKTYWHYRPSGQELFTDSLVLPDKATDEERRTIAEEMRLTIEYMLSVGRFERSLPGDDETFHIPLRRAHSSELKPFNPVGEDGLQVRTGTNAGCPSCAPGEPSPEHWAPYRPAYVDFVPYKDGVSSLLDAYSGLFVPVIDFNGLIPTLRFTRVQGSKTGWEQAVNSPTARQIIYTQDDSLGKYRSVWGVGRTPNSWLLGIGSDAYDRYHCLPQYPDSVEDGFNYLLKTAGGTPTHLLEDGETLADPAAKFVLVDEDVKGFDLVIPPAEISCAVNALSDVLEEYPEAFPSVSPHIRSGVRTVLQDLLVCPVVTTGDTSEAEADLMIWQRLGGQNSGSQLTSVLGSIIETRRIVRHYATVAKVSFYEALVALILGVWAFLIQSDDTVALIPARLVKAWVAADTGAYTIKRSGLPIYLQRPLDLRVARDDAFYTYALVMRMFAGLLNKEIGRESMDFDVQMLGIEVRRELLRGHPAADVFDAMCQMDPKMRVVYQSAVHIGLAELERRVAQKMAAGGADREMTSLMEGFYSTFSASSLAQRRFNPEATWLVEILKQRSYLDMATVRELARNTTYKQATAATKKRLQL